MMEQPQADGAPIEAEAQTRCGAVRIVRQAWTEAIDRVSAPPLHHLELALLPVSRGARGGFPDRWGPGRFEPIGALFLFPAGLRIHARSECREQSSIVCHLRPEAVQAWTGGALEWTDARLRASLDIANPVLRNLLLRLGGEMREPGFASAVLIELMTAEIAIELLRHCLAVTERSVAGGLAPWRLRRIDERLAEPGLAPTLEDLAALCGLSIRQLTRGFRASRGRSIGRHIADSRMGDARRLLASDLPIKAIAHQTGFASPSGFSIAFRRATGETPRAFRQRAGRGTEVRILS